MRVYKLCDSKTFYESHSIYPYHPCMVYLAIHLPYKSTKCRYIYHTWILWVYTCPFPSLDLGFLSPFPTGQGHEGGRLRSQSNQENDFRGTRRTRVIHGLGGAGLQWRLYDTWSFFFLGGQGTNFTPVWQIKRIILPGNKTGRYRLWGLIQVY